MPGHPVRFGLQMSGGFLAMVRWLIGSSIKSRRVVLALAVVVVAFGVWHLREQNQPNVYQAALSRNPTGRMATPQDIANASVFLASPASSFTTGSNLIVDGAISNRVNF